MLLIIRSKLQLSNETMSRDLKIKDLESKLKSARTQATLALIESVADLSAQHSEAAVAPATSTLTTSLTRDVVDLRRQLVERDQDEVALMQEIDRYNEMNNNRRLKVILSESRKSQSNEKTNFDLQLKLLEQRGKLKTDEIKKITDLNADLFGHSNSRQKIKHVAQLKEENIVLREVIPTSFNHR